MPKHKKPPYIMGMIAYKCPNCNNHTFVMIEYTDMNFKPSRLRRFLECGKCGVHYYFPKTTTKLLKPAEHLKKSANYYVVRRAFAHDRKIEVKKWNHVFEKIKTDSAQHVHCEVAMLLDKSNLLHNLKAWVCPKCGHKTWENDSN
jgi:transcription elongation factor Elf1